MDVCIAGWAHSRFGRSEAEGAEELVAEVVPAALDHAGCGAEEIDAIYLGAFNNGFQKQDFQASLVALAEPALRHVPATRLENACATGSAAIHAGINAIRAGQAKRVLVVGVEKMTEIPTKAAGEVLLGACYVREEADVEGGFAGVFGQVTDAYFQAWGDRSASLARIAAKNHRNGLNNPLAHMQKDFGFEFCNTVSDKNPIVAGPLRRTDCSMISDGSAALVLTTPEIAEESGRPVIGFRSTAQVNDFLPVSRRSKISFDGAALAWAKALEDAGVTLDDLSLVETHDCFTIAELIEYEAMGLAEPGQGFRVVDEGLTEMDGRLPVNPSGGLKSKGHPIGATGVSMHVMAAMQLAGDAGAMQVKDAEMAGIFNMGGLSVANYVSILERVR